MCRLSKMGRKEKGERRYNKLRNTVNLFYHLIKLIAITWAAACLHETLSDVASLETPSSPFTKQVCVKLSLISKSMKINEPIQRCPIFFFFKES